MVGKVMGTVWNIGKAAPARIMRAALDFALPARCITCTAAVTAHNALCSACWSRLNFIETPR
ncbi:MAG: double zinc ribbon domain-containing protein [Aestuariivirgaceae bacterium]